MLGRGGFGSVFRAVDPSLQREVAIKVPRRVRVDGQDYSPWMAEAQAVAKLDHPHIVPIFDVGASEEYPLFVVSKYIRGDDLRTVMQREKPSVAQTVDWIVKIADALQHAHKSGLVHRDVKPSNLLIDENQHPWLTDFGLALREEEIGHDANRNRLVGTISYMSPEQARGEGHLVDGRADVFALGIILYELLSGSRPFKGGSSEQILRNIVRAEPWPLRQWDAALPPELERICMKALAQRRTDRYSSAHDMAFDLRQATAENIETTDSVSEHAMASSVSGEASKSEPADDVRIVPKGLRSFDEHDREFFLKLVPGPRDREGVPEILRRLRLRIESKKEEQSFRVGLLYGPSGSGKSSLIRAGLIPLLPSSVHVAYVESDAQQTESRLLQAVAPLADSQDDAENLVATMAAIRRDGAGGGRKVLIILDQFEQWLHSHPIMEGSELVNAIRQCDGVHVQCLLLIRDDFWMPATQFFHELEIRLVQDINSSAVDRFDSRHAKFVLQEFGRAYGCLPDDASEISAEQDKFLDAVIESLAEDGKIISVHLVVVAQMLKSQPWRCETLERLGGTSGVDVNFLDATFSSSVSSPHHRALEAPARKVLAELLPEMGSNIKGQMQEDRHLREVSGLGAKRFQRLVEVLDAELRLITPTFSSDTDAQHPRRCHQLTHDFLVPPLREWLHRNESQTIQGRTRLRLRELSQFWRQKHDKRFLPNQNEFLRVLAFTSSSRRTPDESRLVAAAAVHHGVRWMIAAVVLIAFGVGAAFMAKRVRADATEREAALVVNQLLAADVQKVPSIIQSLRPLAQQADPLLRNLVAESDTPAHERMLARLALVEGDPAQVQPLIEATRTAEADEIRMICEGLKHHVDDASVRLWDLVESDSLDPTQWLRTAYALAQLNSSDPRWSQQADRLARVLVSQSTPRVVDFVVGLESLGPVLVEPTQTIYRTGQSESDRINAAIILASCVSPTDPRFSELLVTATASQFEILFPVAEMRPKKVAADLESGTGDSRYCKLAGRRHFDPTSRGVRSGHR